MTSATRDPRRPQRQTAAIRRGTHFAALLLAAWTMGLEQAHVLEWAPKATYPGPLYTRLQESLYVWFGYFGSVVELLAVLAGLTLAILSRRDRLARVPLAAAAALEAIALIVFFAVVYPVNFRFPVHGPGTVPADWTALRDRWELGHAIGFALFTAAFILLLTSALRPGDPPASVLPGDPASAGVAGSSRGRMKLWASSNRSGRWRRCCPAAATTDTTSCSGCGTGRRSSPARPPMRWRCSAAPGWTRG